ncbi:hypothetical protein Xoosp13_208 [Xanthomonas phage Xoo-sp13]|nr:hypothetical protein Xoosp13_208 [Xanthomonas phage Xoo-sp13]
MNFTQRLQELSGIPITESVSVEKKYEKSDKAELNKAKTSLQSVLLTASRSSFQYKNAEEELKVVKAALAKLDAPAEKVKEAAEVPEVPEAFKKKDGDSSSEKDTDEDEDDSEKKSDKDADSDEKKTEKKDDKDDDSDKDKDDKSEKDKDDKSEKDKDDKSEKKDTDEDDSDKKAKKKDDKEVKESVKLTPEQIAAMILEKDATTKAPEVDYQNAPKENDTKAKDLSTKIRLPSSVKSVVKSRIQELEAAIVAYDDKGFDNDGVKQNAVDALNQILENVAAGDAEGIKKAQVYFSTLMSPITTFFPPQLVNWLANALNSYVKEGKDDLWVLKVKTPDSDKYTIQFSGTKSECTQEWKDDKHNWPKGSKASIERHSDTE